MTAASQASAERLRVLLSEDSADFSAGFREIAFPQGWRRRSSKSITTLHWLCEFSTSVPEQDRGVVLDALHDCLDRPAHADAACKTDLVRVLIDEIRDNPPSSSSESSSAAVRLLGKLSAFSLSHELAELWLRRISTHETFTPAAPGLLEALRQALSRPGSDFVDVHGFTSVSSFFDFDGDESALIVQPAKKFLGSKGYGFFGYVRPELQGRCSDISGSSSSRVSDATAVVQHQLFCMMSTKVCTAPAEAILCIKPCPLPLLHRAPGVFPI